MTETSLNSILEQRMLDAGATRYINQQRKIAERQEMTSAQSKLFQEALFKVATAMQAALDDAGGPGRPPEWLMPLQTLGAMQSAHIALRLVFAAIGHSGEYGSLIVAIGRQAEVELIAKAVAEKDEALYKSLVRRVSKLRSVAFKSKVFLEMSEEAGFWEPLKPDNHAKIGAGFLNFVLESSDLFETVTQDEGTDKQLLMVCLTEDAAVRIDDIAEAEAWMRPVYMPMLSRPKDWETAYTGAYEEPKIAATVKAVRTFVKASERAVDAAIQAGAPFAQALNAIQAVPLQMNPTVVEWLEKSVKADMTVGSFPEPVVVIPKDAPKEAKAELRVINRERSALKKELLNTVSMAAEYTELGTFYLPATLDWRGRVYAKPHLNHQREDHCKALFQFDEGQVLTTEGAVWLAIHVANTGAFKGADGKAMDKAPLDVRVKWTHDNTERILSMMKDPAADLWWTEADSPFMFLGACDAWAQYCANPEGYLCRLPVGVDGSCSGLQHFSAMLRDPIGGGHVNLLPAGAPGDVYAAVAAAVLPLVQADALDGHEVANRWLSIGITRKVSKRCVMTYVYGSKQFGFAEHLADDFRKEIEGVVKPDMVQGEDEEDWQFRFRTEREIKATAAYLAKHIWTAVQTTVRAAAEGMDWLQKVAALLATEGIAATWTTPAGFPVANAYYEPLVERLQLTLWDRAINVKRKVQPSVTTGYSRKLLARKCRSSISPNFVHSLDAAHLHMAVLKAKAEGITSVLLIHDSFSCLPNDMPRFSQIVRETFVEMYQNSDPLGDLYEFAKSVLSAKGLKELTPPPQRGDLDLENVLESLYAFA